MILREPLTFIVITVLIFAFSGTLFDDLIGGQTVRCYKQNQYMLEHNQLGPMRPC